MQSSWASFSIDRHGWVWNDHGGVTAILPLAFIDCLGPALPPLSSATSGLETIFVHPSLNDSLVSLKRILPFYFSQLSGKNLLFKSLPTIVTIVEERYSTKTGLLEASNEMKKRKEAIKDFIQSSLKKPLEKLDFKEIIYPVADFFLELTELFRVLYLRNYINPSLLEDRDLKREFEEVSKIRFSFLSFPDLSQLLIKFGEKKKNLTKDEQSLLEYLLDYANSTLGINTQGEPRSNLGDIYKLSKEFSSALQARGKAQKFQERLVILEKIIDLEWKTAQAYGVKNPWQLAQSAFLLTPATLTRIEQRFNTSLELDFKRSYEETMGSFETQLKKILEGVRSPELSWNRYIFSLLEELETIFPNVKIKIPSTSPDFLIGESVRLIVSHEGQDSILDIEIKEGVTTNGSLSRILPASPLKGGYCKIFLTVASEKISNDENAKWDLYLSFSHELGHALRFLMKETLIGEEVNLNLLRDLLEFFSYPAQAYFTRSEVLQKLFSSMSQEDVAKVSEFYIIKKRKKELELVTAYRFSERVYSGTSMRPIDDILSELVAEGRIAPFKEIPQPILRHGHKPDLVMYIIGFFIEEVMVKQNLVEQQELLRQIFTMSNLQNEMKDVISSILLENLF